MTAGIHSGAAGLLPVCRKESRTADGMHFRQTGRDWGQLPEGVRGDREDHRAARRACRAAHLLPVRAGAAGRAHRSAYRRGLAASGRAGAAAAPDGTRDFRRLFGLLNQPHAAMGTWGFARPVWHCSMRAAPEDKTLSDEEWAQIACDVMHRTGLAPYGEEDDAVRWVAIRHGDDHIHIVAMLARQDGRRPSVRNDRYRVRDACLAAERRYGLRPTAPGDRTAARRPSRAEPEKAARHGAGRGAAGHAAAPGQHRRRGGGQRAGVLRPAPPSRRARPHPAQHPRPCPGHRVRRRPSRRHRQGRGPGLVRRRETRRGPDPAQAAAPLAPARQR